MKKFLTLTLLSLTLMLTNITSGQFNPPPSAISNDVMIQKSAASYAVVPVDVDSLLVQITFVYSYLDANGIPKKVMPRLDGYTFQVFQIFSPNMPEYPLTCKYTWRTQPYLINDNLQNATSVVGYCLKPTTPMWLIWVLFNDNNPVGNIRTGNIRIK